MLKFIKHHMETISGIEIYPIISFIIFFTFFVFVLIYVVKADKKTIDEIANIPLNSNESDHEED
jgi:cytochrome c oxidase cbb3-type subunit 4